MTIVDGRHRTCVRVGSKMMEQILLNISPDCLNRVIGKIATHTTQLSHGAGHRSSQHGKGTVL